MMDELCSQLGIEMVNLDGPQRRNIFGLFHAVCEVDFELDKS